MKFFRIVSILVFLAVFTVMRVNAGDGAPHAKFRKVFVFSAIPNEAYAQKLAELRVYAVSCPGDAKTIALAKKYGIKPMLGFGPAGLHTQVLQPEKHYRQAELSGRFLPKELTGAEREKAVTALRKKCRHRYGGEPDAGADDVLTESMPCFVGAAAREKARGMLLAKLGKAKGVEGVMFDYVGYTDFHGCAHPDCLHLLKQYLAANGLPDTQGNRDRFFLEELVAYNNFLIDTIKKFNPELITASHLYPVFLPEPLYGNRLKFDYCGQTCAWYFLWPAEKIRAYAKNVVSDAEKYHAGAVGVPFIGFATAAPDTELWADRKTPEIVEKELRAILDAGGDTLMIHTVRDVIAEPEVFAVFKKFCGEN